MYIIPGYTKYSEESGSIYVVSKLLQNKVALTDPAIQDEFRTIVSNGGCQELSTLLPGSPRTGTSGKARSRLIVRYQRSKNLLGKVSC